MASYDTGKSDIEKEVRKYCRHFSRVIDIVLGYIDDTDGKAELRSYEDRLLEETKREFPAAMKRMDNIAHWILHDNGIIAYSANGNHASCKTYVRRNSRTKKEIRQMTEKTVRKYIVTIIAKADGQEKANEMFPEEQRNVFLHRGIQK